MRNKNVNMSAALLRTILITLLHSVCFFNPDPYTFQSAAYCFASDFDDYEDFEEESAEFTIQGFIEFENFLNTYKDQDFEDANKKNEIRSRLEIRYGTDSLYLYVVPNIYVSSTLIKDRLGKDYNYSDKTELFRNLRYSSSSYEVSFNEFYLNFTQENYRIRVGNQIFGWGTADVFNPTAYFNPFDMREIIFKEDDEYKAGVPSVSAMIFFDDTTLELVVVPVHIPGIIAENGDFWSLAPDNYQLPIILGEIRGLDIDSSNSGYGARFSATTGSTDFSFSCYHGPDVEPVYLPFRTVLSPNESVSVLVEPQYHVINRVGLDFSMTIDDFVVQFEAAYSPDKRGYKEAKFENAGGIVLPLEVEQSDHIWYSVGFNYFIPLYRLIDDHEGETVFTFEWSQSKYFEDDFSDPFSAKIMSFRFEDSYYSNRLNVSLAGIFDIQRNGHSIWPKIGYDFLNGFSTELSYACISGKSDSINTTESIFYYFRDNDILIWEVRYDF
jgi:hypothetical protein